MYYNIYGQSQWWYIGLSYINSEFSLCGLTCSYNTVHDMAILVIRYN